MLATQTLQNSIASHQTAVNRPFPPTTKSSFSPSFTKNTLTAQNLRTATHAKALPEISNDMIIQSAAVGHAAKTLAFCGFSMLGINASSEYLSKKTGNDMINTVATSIAAIAIGAVIRNELTDMQAVFAKTKIPSVESDFTSQPNVSQPNASQSNSTQSSEASLVTSPMREFPEKSVLNS